jgi:hypothetical protein
MLLIQLICTKSYYKWQNNNIDVVDLVDMHQILL